MKDAEERGCRVRIPSNSILEVLDFVSPTLKSVHSPPTDPRLRERGLRRSQSGEGRIHAGQDCIQGEQVRRVILPTKSSNENLTTTPQAIEEKPDYTATRAHEETNRDCQMVKMNTNKSEDSEIAAVSIAKNEDRRGENCAESTPNDKHKKSHSVKESITQAKQTTVADKVSGDKTTDDPYENVVEEVQEFNGFLRCHETNTLTREEIQLAEKTKITASITASSTKTKPLASHKADVTRKATLSRETSTSKEKESKIKSQLADKSMVPTTSTTLSTQTKALPSQKADATGKATTTRKKSTSSENNKVQENLKSSNRLVNEQNRKRQLSQGDRVDVPKKRHCNDLKKKHVSENNHNTAAGGLLECNDNKNASGKTVSKPVNTKEQDLKTKKKVPPDTSSLNPKSPSLTAKHNEGKDEKLKCTTTKRQERSSSKQQGQKETNRDKSTLGDLSKVHKTTSSKQSSESTVQKHSVQDRTKKKQQKAVTTKESLKNVRKDPAGKEICSTSRGTLLSKNDGRQHPKTVNKEQQPRKDNSEHAKSNAKRKFTGELRRIPRERTREFSERVPQDRHWYFRQGREHRAHQTAYRESDAKFRDRSATPRRCSSYQQACSNEHRDSDNSPRSRYCDRDSGSGREMGQLEKEADRGYRKRDWYTARGSSEVNSRERGPRLKEDKEWEAREREPKRWYSGEGYEREAAESDDRERYPVEGRRWNESPQRQRSEDDFHFQRNNSRNEEWTREVSGERGSRRTGSNVHERHSNMTWSDGGGWDTDHDSFRSPPPLWTQERDPLRDFSSHQNNFTKETRIQDYVERSPEPGSPRCQSPWNSDRWGQEQYSPPYPEAARFPPDYQGSWRNPPRNVGWGDSHYNQDHNHYRHKHEQQQEADRQKEVNNESEENIPNKRCSLSAENVRTGATNARSGYDKDLVRAKIKRQIRDDHVFSLSIQENEKCEAESNGCNGISRPYQAFSQSVKAMPSSIPETSDNCVGSSTDVVLITCDKLQRKYGNITYESSVLEAREATRHKDKEADLPPSSSSHGLVFKSNCKRASTPSEVEFVRLVTNNNEIQVKDIVTTFDATGDSTVDSTQDYEELNLWDDPAFSGVDGGDDHNEEETPVLLKTHQQERVRSPQMSGDKRKVIRSQR